MLWHKKKQTIRPEAIRISKISDRVLIRKLISIKTDLEEVKTWIKTCLMNNAELIKKDNQIRENNQTDHKTEIKISKTIINRYSACDHRRYIFHLPDMDKSNNVQENNYPKPNTADKQFNNQDEFASADGGEQKTSHRGADKDINSDELPNESQSPRQDKP